MPDLAPDYALVLTGPALTDGHIDTVKKSITGMLKAASSPLAPGEAHQWFFDSESEIAANALATARHHLATSPVDINLVPNDSNRRKQLLIADMDSTIIEQECIDQLADFAGYGAQVAAITEQAMRGELDFQEAITVRVALLEGLDTTALDRVIAERLTIMPGARELIATMKANGALCALVSGGFTFFTSRIADTVGFDLSRANTLEIDNGKLTGRVVPPILGRQAKLDTMNELVTTHDINSHRTLAVGDGANDLAMIKAASLGAAYHAKPIVAAEADVQLTHSDLSALLYLQGYHRDEIIC